MKLSSIIKKILFFLCIFFVVLIVYSTNWAIENFEFINFAEIIFQLTTPIKSTSKDILMRFFKLCFMPAVFLSIIIVLFLLFLFDYLDCKKILFKIKLWKFNFEFNIKAIILRLLLVVITISLCSYNLYVCLDKVKFIEFVYYQVNPSNFIEENYVDSKEVKITAPEKKKNLIYIYVESLESTFFSKEYGGADDNNYLEPLVGLTQENVQFSDGDKFGGAYGLSDTGWTSSALVASTSGLPLKTRKDVYFVGNTSLINNVYTLGDVLKDNGYNQMLLIGSDGDFGNRSKYFTDHGYTVFDYKTAIQTRRIDEKYNVWWGFEDSKLFSYAKDELIDLSKKGAPFNLTLLTTGTHPLDGFIEDDCTGNFSSAYGNAIYCSSLQILAFVNWIKEQDFYDDTTIVITGDHVSMQPNLYPEGTKRRIYNLFINSAVKDGNFKNRSFSNFDLFPTTLSSLGFSIDGDKLALGVNLFSDKKTILEEYGEEEANIELRKYSKFYMDKFFYDN